MFTVDRIEDETVVLEDRNKKTLIDVNMSLFDFKLNEGDIIDFVDNKYIKNKEETKNKKRDILNRFNKLKK